MKIAIGSDHGGFSLKQALVDEVKKLGHTVVDCGASEYDAKDDYPDFARAVGMAIQRGDAERGIILCGSGVVALGAFLGKRQRGVLLYWVGIFLLIAVGVGAMFVLSALGGIGGKSGHSMWWGVLILPYPVGWLMALAAAILALIRFLKTRGRGVHS
jgi:hypothetical protein